VEARVAVRNGHAESVTLRNVPAFLYERDREVEVPGLGRLRLDLAFGGNFFAILPAAAAGLEVDEVAARDLIDAGLRIMAAVNESGPPVHPEQPKITGCHHVILHADGRDGADGRSATAVHPGWLDRSPCGTGTSARMAQLHARGEFALGDAFVHESVIGTRFTGRLVGETDAGGLAAVVPEITGRAWVTGMAQYLLDPDDPFPAGFAL
jgi:proline racemase